MRRGRGLHAVLVGAAPPQWHSLTRSYSFFRDALQGYFKLSLCPSFPLPPRLSRSCQVAIAFAPALGNDNAVKSPMPVLYPVWGGAVLQHELLRTHVTAQSERDRLIVNCRSDADILATMAARNCELLRLPVRHGCFHPVSKAFAKKSIGLSPRTAVIGLVARLIPEKNLHLFLKILATLRGQPTERHVVGVIVGDFWEDYPTLRNPNASYRDSVAELVQALKLDQSIKLFSAKLTDSQLNLVYNSCDVLVHPTMCVDENFGYAPVEAMACGTPVVATAYGGLKDTVVQGRCGLLEPTWITAGGIRTDWQGLTEKVRSLLAAPHIRRRMRKNCVNRAREDFSYRSAARQLRDIVYRAVNGEPVNVATAVAQPATRTPDGSIYVRRIHSQWKNLVFPVSRYVSGSPPRLRGNSCVYAYAGWRDLSETSVELMDPLWRVQYVMSSRQMRVLRAIGDRCSPVRRLLGSGFNLGEIQEMVDAGVLVPTDPDVT